jgi:hypothetical protein
VRGCISSLQEQCQASGADLPAPSHLYWVDISYEGSSKSCEAICDEETGAAEEGGGSSALVSDARHLNRLITEIVSACDGGTIVSVLTQGDMAELRRFASSKLRRRWHENSVKVGSASVHLRAHSSRAGSWTPQDEDDLLGAAARVIAGCLFIKQI